MATLTDKAVLELIVDSTKGVASLAEFQEKFSKGFADLQGLVHDTGEEFDGLTEGINAANDPLRGYASVAEEAAVGTAEWAKAISLVDPQLGAMVTKIEILSKRLGSKNVALGESIATLGRFALVAGVATGAGLALGEGLKAIANDLGDQNRGLALTADLLKTLGFEKAGAELDGYVDKVRLGALILNGMAEEQARVTLEIEKARDAVEGDRRGIEDRIVALRKYREELQASAVSEEEKARLLARLAGVVREVLKEVDEYGTTVKDGTAAEREFVEWLEKREKAMAESVATTEEATKADEERYAELEKELDKATGATEDNTKAVQKQEGAYRAVRDQISATTAALRDQVQILRESVREQREAAGIDDRQASVEGLRQEIEALEDAEIRTIEQENRLDEAKGQLIQSERELRDALADTNLFYDEHNLAVDEATLAAIEAERQQQRLNEALGLTTETQGELGEATDEAALAFQEQKEQADAVAEGVSGIAAAVKVADPVVMGFLAKMNAELRVSIDLLQAAKQCAVDLGGAMDNV